MRFVAFSIFSFLSSLLAFFFFRPPPLSLPCCFFVAVHQPARHYITLCVRRLIYIRRLYFRRAHDFPPQRVAGSRAFSR